MAVANGNVRQQQTGSAQAGAAPSQAARGPNDVGQTQLPADFHQALEQQIAQAIQPVLDDFRQQIAQGLSSQAQSDEASGRSEQPSERQSEEASAREDTHPEGQGDAHQTGGGPDHAGTQAAVPVKNIASSAQRGGGGLLTGPLNQALQSVEHLGGQWLQSILVAGIGGLLAESTHAAVQQRAEEGLHTLLQKLFDAMPAGVTNQKMEGKTERTLQVILRDALDAVFGEQVRTSLQQGGQQGIEQSPQGDFGAVLAKVRETFQVMAAALVEVLRRHQATIIRLLLAFALLALEASLVQPEQQK